MESNIWDVQASEPYERTDANGVVTKHRPQHVNRRLHILTTTMECAVELMHEHHPEAVLHQIIKRNSISDVIVDPAVTA